MTNAERVLACKFLDLAANEFSSHICNDVDQELFDDFSEEEMDELLRGYNAWNLGETAETCGDPTDEWTPIKHIGDDAWMGYLSAVIGRGTV